MAPRPRLGKFLIGLGVSGLIRLLPESLQIHGDRLYIMLITLDGVLALATAIAGEGLRRGKGWAPKVAICTAAIVVPTSIGVGLLMIRAFKDFGVMNLFLARGLYYIIVVAFWPFGVGTLIAAAESRKGLLPIFFVSLLLGVPLGVYLNSALR